MKTWTVLTEVEEDNWTASPFLYLDTCQAVMRAQEIAKFTVPQIVPPARKDVFRRMFYFWLLEMKSHVDSYGFLIPSFGQVRINIVDYIKKIAKEFGMEKEISILPFENYRDPRDWSVIVAWINQNGETCQYAIFGEEIE